MIGDTVYIGAGRGDQDDDPDEFDRAQAARQGEESASDGEQDADLVEGEGLFF